jgi:hypothetical protein
VKEQPITVAFANLSRAHRKIEEQDRRAKEQEAIMIRVNSIVEKQEAMIRRAAKGD